MRSSVVSLEHELERVKEENKEVETVCADICSSSGFVFEAFCYLNII